VLERRLTSDEVISCRRYITLLTSAMMNSTKPGGAKYDNPLR